MQPSGPGLPTDPAPTGPPSAPTTHMGGGGQPLQAAGSAHSSHAQAFPAAPRERCGCECKGHGGTHKHILTIPLWEGAQQGTLLPGQPSTLGHQGLTAHSFFSVGAEILVNSSLLPALASASNAGQSHPSILDRAGCSSVCQEVGKGLGSTGSAVPDQSMWEHWPNAPP